MRAYTLDIQKFLRSYRSITEGNSALLQRFNVDVLQDVLEFGDNKMEVVWVYNYDFLTASGGSRIENEARGLILNASAEVVTMAFPRFFNHGEIYAADIDWSQANAEFKNDGTLITIYSYRDNYFISTRGRANADGHLDMDLNTTYYEKVYSWLQSKFPDDPFGPFKKHNEDQKYVWVFEYVGPNNRIVTPYEEDNLILLTAYNKSIPAEILPEYVDQFANEYEITRPAFRKVRSMDDVNRLLDKMDPLEEGVVVVDYRYRRIKVKNPSYLAINRIKNMGKDIRPRHFASMVLKGDGAEMASYFPEYKEILLFLEEVVREVMADLQEEWIKFRLAPDKKEFALHVKDHPLSHILFLAWEGKVKDMSDALKYIKPEQLVYLATEYHPTDFHSAFDSAILRITGEAEKEEKEQHASK